MIEVHDPVRLLMIVEQQPEIVLATISANPELYHWFMNEWIHLIAVDPCKKSLYRFTAGAFVPYVPLTQHVPEVEDISSIIETSTLMETSRILDAIREHIPVHVLKE
jgi:hypothetical protein